MVHQLLETVLIRSTKANWDGTIKYIKAEYRKRFRKTASFRKHHLDLNGLNLRSIILTSDGFYHFNSRFGKDHDR